MKTHLYNVIATLIVFSVCIHPCWPGNAALGARVQETGIILVEDLDVQSEPGQHGFLQKRLKKGTRVKIIKRFQGWLQILHAGEVGFIREDSSLVKIIQETPVKPPKVKKEESQSADRKIENLKQQAEDIDRKIETGKARVQTFTQKEIDAINRLNALNFELHKSRKRLGATKSEIKKLENAITETTATSAELKKQIQTSEHFMAQRMVALYKLNQIGQINILATANNINDLIQRKIALERILAYDESLRKKMEQDRLQYDEQVSQLTRRKTKIGKLAKKYERQLKRISADQSKRKKILVQIQNQKSMELAAIETLKNSAKELDREINAIGNQSISPPTSRNLTEKPITSFKGLLKMPVKGKIAFLFGPYKNKKFNVVNFRSGIGISTKKGEPVRAVFKGTVVFSNWFKGYGNMVIIDHGANYHTVYAHLEDVFKSTGESVKTGEVIATVGDTGLISEINLHFEIRHHGKPQDPLQWLKRS